MRALRETGSHLLPLGLPLLTSAPFPADEIGISITLHGYDTSDTTQDCWTCLENIA